MKPLSILIVFVSLALTPSLLAQKPVDKDPDAESDPEVIELSEELEELAVRKQNLLQQAELTQRRIELLTKVRALRILLRTIEPKLEAAEENEDERTFLKLREQAEVAEFQLELTHAKLESLERLLNVTELLGELSEASMKPYRKEAESLLPLISKGESLAERFFKALKDEDEEAADQLGEEREQLGEVVTIRREILQLKVELYHAVDRDDEDAIEELQDEIKELRSELNELGEKDDQADDDMKSAKSTRPKVELPAPISLTSAEVQQAGRLNFEQRVQPLLQSACFDCHDTSSASGDLDLQTLIQTKPFVIHRKHWINVIQQLKVRSMPPADADQPTETQRRLMVAWLTNAIDNFDYTTVRQPGYEPARRLTHDEYNNTVRDLTGIDIRPADRFPADLTATSGFENSANSLFLQPITLERYINAAESIVKTAWPESLKSPTTQSAWKDLVGNQTDLSQTANIQNILLRFTAKAYRRPVDADEVASLMSHYQRRIAAGRSAKLALRDVLQVVFVSPNFLIRSERDGANVGQPYRITDAELANRLSYFLWASMPDDRLFELARRQTLHQPQVLAAEVDRMLADPRTTSLGHIFASQWLGFTDLGRVRPGQIDNPWATDSLIAAMQQESAMLFNTLIQTNAPLDRLIDADFTFVNEELAEHYGMDDIDGDTMQQVSLRDSPRRGVLGHGSILAVTSFPGRTSPVLRGNWILTKLLGTPPPPPPPNVSQFDERVAENRRLTQRQKLELHRGNANCYACHSQIDPLGFALEEFEWFGRHRPTRRGKRIDSTGQLPGGEEFKGLAGLSKALLNERIDDLTNQAARKMLSYALGRQLQYYDEATVQDIVKSMQSNDRRLQSMIHAIVNSDTFQMKQK